MPRWGTSQYDGIREIAISRAPAHFTVTVSKGLANGPADRGALGDDARRASAGHEALEIIAEYLGQLATSITLMLSVERVVFGGGVMADGQLTPLVHEAAARYLNGYL